MVLIIEDLVDNNWAALSRAHTFTTSYRNWKSVITSLNYPELHFSFVWQTDYVQIGQNTRNMLWINTKIQSTFPQISQKSNDYVRVILFEQTDGNKRRWKQFPANSGEASSAWRGARMPKIRQTRSKAELSRGRNQTAITVASQWSSAPALQLSTTTSRHSNLI